MIETRQNPQNHWLITGGCGFIGLSLIRYIKETRPGDYIRIYDNLSVGTRNDLEMLGPYKEISVSEIENKYAEQSIYIPDQKIELMVDDITNFKSCVTACTGISHLVHLAANTGVGPSVEDPKSDMEANVIGTFNMLEAAKQNNIMRFVFASSGAPIGEAVPPIHEELAPHPVSPYGASKLAGEGYCSAYFRTFGLETVSLRFGNVYGPGSAHKSSVVAKFIKRAMKGEHLTIYGDGKQTRDFIYIKDLIKAIRLASEAGDCGGEVFQIASNKETTLSEMANLLVNELKIAGIESVKIRYKERRRGDVIRNFSDTTKAKIKLGWTPEYSLSQGIKETVHSFVCA